MCYHHTREPRGRQRMIRNGRTIPSDCRVNVRFDPFRTVLLDAIHELNRFESNQIKSNQIKSNQSITKGTEHEKLYIYITPLQFICIN